MCASLAVTWSLLTGSVTPIRVSHVRGAVQPSIPNSTTAARDRRRAPSGSPLCAYPLLASRRGSHRRKLRRGEGSPVSPVGPGRVFLAQVTLRVLAVSAKQLGELIGVVRKAPRRRRSIRWLRRDTRKVGRDGASRSAHDPIEDKGLLAERSG